MTPERRSGGACGKMPLVGELTDGWRAFLAERRYAVLATHDPGGDVRLTPIWFLFEDDRFHFFVVEKQEGEEHRAEQLRLGGCRFARTGAGAMDFRFWVG